MGTNLVNGALEKNNCLILDLFGDFFYGNSDDIVHPFFSLLISCISIVLDESGAMHLKNERYFVIAGFITRELHKVTSMHKKVEKMIKMRKNIPITKKVELKSSKINVSQQALFLNES